MNNKARFNELSAAAAAAIEQAGGVAAITDHASRLAVYRAVVAATYCHPNSAKRHVNRLLGQQTGGSWGGARAGATGRPRK